MTVELLLRQASEKSKRHLGLRNTDMSALCSRNLKRTEAIYQRQAGDGWNPRSPDPQVGSFAGHSVKTESYTSGRCVNIIRAGSSYIIPRSTSPGFLWHRGSTSHAFGTGKVATLTRPAFFLREDATRSPGRKVRSSCGREGRIGHPMMRSWPIVPRLAVMSYFVVRWCIKQDLTSLRGPVHLAFSSS